MRRPPPRKQKGTATGPRRLSGEVMDVATAAAWLGVKDKCVRARVARRQLPYRRWGGRVVFLKAELLAYLGRLPGVTLEQAIGNNDA
jgi:hypothetical protein